MVAVVGHGLAALSGAFCFRAEVLAFEPATWWLEKLEGREKRERGEEEEEEASVNSTTTAAPRGYATLLYIDTEQKTI